MTKPTRPTRAELEAENARLKAWCAYLEESAARTAAGFGSGILAWAEALRDMSPIQDAPDESYLVDGAGPSVPTR